MTSSRLGWNRAIAALAAGGLAVSFGAMLWTGGAGDVGVMVHGGYAGAAQRAGTGPSGVATTAAVWTRAPTYAAQPAAVEWANSRSLRGGAVSPAAASEDPSIADAD